MTLCRNTRSASLHGCMFSIHIGYFASTFEYDQVGAGAIWVVGTLKALRPFVRVLVTGILVHTHPF